jgi:hypothetical protein
LALRFKKNGPGSYTFQADDVNVGYLETEALKEKVVRAWVYNDCWSLLARFEKDIFKTWW